MCVGVCGCVDVGGCGFVCVHCPIPAWCVTFLLMQLSLKEWSVRFWPAEVSHTENFVGYKVTLKGEDVSPSFTTLQLVVQPDAEVNTGTHAVEGGGEGEVRGSERIM